MEWTAIDDAASAEPDSGVDRRSLADALGATDLALNYYRVPPGEGFPSGLHAHGDQEEVFVVLDGEATYETLVPRGEADGDPEDDGDHENYRDLENEGDREGAEWAAGAVTVAAGEAIRFAPGEYQSGRNAGDEDLVALALGAPPDGDDVRIPLDCPACGHGFLRPEAGGDGDVRLVCPACDAQNAPDGCPNCGSEMRVALAESEDSESEPPPETVVVCPACGAEAATPFRS